MGTVRNQTRAFLKCDSYYSAGLTVARFAGLVCCMIFLSLPLLFRYFIGIWSKSVSFLFGFLGLPLFRVEYVFGHFLRFTPPLEGIELLTRLIS